MGLYYSSPDAPDYGAAAKESAEAEMEILPLRYQTELEYRPKFDELEFQQQQRSMQSMFDFLMGNEEAGQDGFVNQLYDLDRRTAREGYELDAEWMPIMADLNAQTQLDLQEKYGNEFVDKSLEQARRMDPDWFSTREALAEMVMADLGSGNDMTDEQRRQVEQEFRRSQAARGNLMGDAVSADEVLNKFLAGEGLRDKRMQRASAFLGGQQTNTQTGGVPSAQVGAAPYQVHQPGAMGSYGANPGAFTGFGNAGSVWNQAGVNAGTQSVYGFQTQNYLANQEAKQSFWGDMAGSAMGMAGGMMMCWVAREVYGADNPKWKEFREWMLEDAPADLRSAYREHGEAYAEHIRNKPELKARWRRFMDRAIAEHRLLHADDPKTTTENMKEGY